MRRIVTAARDDRGSTMLLAIGYGVLALVVILVVVAATSLLIERRRLFSLADGAALAGAEAFAVDQLFASEDPSPQLADAAVADAASEWLAVAPTELDGVALVDAQSVDGQTATVTVSSWWRPPVMTLIVPEGLRLDVTVTARAVLSTD